MQHRQQELSRLDSLTLFSQGRQQSGKWMHSIYHESLACSIYVRAMANHAADRGRPFRKVLKDNAAEPAFLLQQVGSAGAGGSRPRIAEED